MHVDRFRVHPGDRSALSRHATDFTGGFDDKEAALKHLKKRLSRLEVLQELLYAQDQYALLLIFQGMDASGKDSAIRRVMSGVSPQGTDVHAFKRPTSEELDHDYLWRAAKVLPARGRIGLFNRSYDEDVLVVRVHPHLLSSNRLPADCITPRIWHERFDDISAFERHLTRNGTIVRKFFLHVSRAEQERRFLERIADPSKNWKYSETDLAERRKWRAYHHAYREALAETSTSREPWYVVPADHKWFAHAVMADVIVDTLARLDLAFPKLTAAQRRAFADAKRQLARD